MINIIINIIIINEKILLTTMLTIHSKLTNYSFKTLFTIPVDLKST